MGLGKWTPCSNLKHHLDLLEAGEDPGVRHYLVFPSSSILLSQISPPLASKTTTVSKYWKWGVRMAFYKQMREVTVVIDLHLCASVYLKVCWDKASLKHRSVWYFSNFLWYSSNKMSDNHAHTEQPCLVLHVGFCTITVRTESLHKTKRLFEYRTFVVNWLIK